MESNQAPVDLCGGRSPLMDAYTIAGLAVMLLVAGLVGLRLAKDEILLRRKSIDKLA